MFDSTKTWNIRDVYLGVGDSSFTQTASLQVSPVSLHTLNPSICVKIDEKKCTKNNKQNKQTNEKEWRTVVVVDHIAVHNYLARWKKCDRVFCSRSVYHWAFNWIDVATINIKKKRQTKFQKFHQTKFDIKIESRDPTIIPCYTHKTYKFIQFFFFFVGFILSHKNKLIELNLSFWLRNKFVASPKKADFNEQKPVTQKKVKISS